MMDRILEITKRVNRTTFLGKDALGRTTQIKSVTPLTVGKSVLLRNGIVVDYIKTVQSKVYEV